LLPFSVEDDPTIELYNEIISLNFDFESRFEKCQNSILILKADLKIVRTVF